MKVGRTFRTVRHLTAEQWLYRFVCRGKFAAMELWPDAARACIGKAAALVPVPDFSSVAYAKVVGHVTQLQRAVHGNFLDGVSAGLFTLLNRTIDFGSLSEVEWRRDLGEKNNRLWRMNLAYLGFLVPLFEADARVALPVAQSLLRSMKEQNPWSEKGVFRDVWHPYTVSHRVLNLLTCLHFLDLAQVGNESDRAPLIEEIRLGTAFVLHNLERDLQYNHLLKNFVCLAAVGGASGDNDFAHAVLREVKASVQQQFLPDGGQAERAPMYHLLSLLDLRILRDSGVLGREAQSSVEQAVVLAEAAVAGMVHPDGDVALFNDSWLGEAPRAIDLLSTLDLRPTQPRRNLLPQTGYVRLAQGPDSVVMDFGACGPDDNPGHAHADFLSLELSVAGERALVDGGVPTYSEGELRNSSRSALAHNGPLIEGAEPIEFWSSFRVGHRGYAHELQPPTLSNENMAFAAWHNGYADTVVARAIWLRPGRGLLIADAWVGGAGQGMKTRFRVGHKWRPSGNAQFVGSGTASDVNLRLTVMDGELSEIASGLHWDRFGVSHEATCLDIRPVGEGPVFVSGVLWSWGDSDEGLKQDWFALQDDLRAALNLLSKTGGSGRVAT